MSYIFVTFDFYRSCKLNNFITLAVNKCQPLWSLISEQRKSLFRNKRYGCQKKSTQSQLEPFVGIVLINSQLLFSPGGDEVFCIQINWSTLHNESIWVIILISRFCEFSWFLNVGRYVVNVEFSLTNIRSNLKKTHIPIGTKGNFYFGIWYMCLGEKIWFSSIYALEKCKRRFFKKARCINS